MTNPSGVHVGQRCQRHGGPEDPVGGMTVCPTAVILETSFGPRERLPGSFEIGCGVTVLSGDDDGRTWSQRYKANLEKLASGDLVQVVEVVRDLAGREATRGLSAGEKRMLAKARLILLQEG
jgi:CarD, C-terminal domain